MEIVTRDASVPTQNMITLECSDAVLFDVDRVMITSMSGAIAKQTDINQNPGRTNPIVLDNIPSAVMAKVLEYCSMYASPLKVNGSLSIWSEKFIRLEPGELCELASAAYHLEIRPLVELTCKAIAKLLKGKTPAEIRKTFNILYDFAPGDDVPPPTVRDKLRNKLYQAPKIKDKTNEEMKQEDNRSLDDLLEFIDGKPNANKKKKKRKSRLRKSNDEQNFDDVRQQEKTHSGSPSPVIDNRNTNGKNNAKNDSQQLVNSGLMEKIQFWASDDEEIDPEVKAEQDREVEEFRMRLEGIQPSAARPKLTIPFDFLNNMHIAR